MKKSDFVLESVRRLARDVYELVLSGDTSGITAPGQFVNIALPGRFLRRPISVCSWTEGGLLLLVREAGTGTGELVRLAPGTRLDLLTGLGNGFDVSVLSVDADPPVSGQVSPGRTALAGGGIGVAPLYGLAKALLKQGAVPAVALGFRTAADAFWLEEFAALGCPLSLSTEDGSLGRRGFVTDLLKDCPERDYVFCCGPTPMLDAVRALPHLRGGQFSLEARMGCGFGVCMGCSIAAKGGMKRVCKDGPVFALEELP